MNKISWQVLCCGMLCLTAAEITALILGYNGTLFKIFIVVIALGMGITIDSKIIIDKLKGGKKNG